jgi:hypothetical protein
MLNNFVGTQYRLADNWFNHIDMNNYKDKQINYLEIGTFYGANILSVAKTYGLHNDSKLYCIDPWEDYNDYPEYKNQQNTIVMDKQIVGTIVGNQYQTGTQQAINKTQLA